MSPADVTEHAISNVERASKLAEKIMKRILAFTIGNDLELDSRSLTEMIFEELERSDRVRDGEKHETLIDHATRVRELERELVDAKTEINRLEQRFELEHAQRVDVAKCTRCASCEAPLETYCEKCVGELVDTHRKEAVFEECAALRDALDLANATLVANQNLSAALRDSTVAALAALRSDEAARAAQSLYDKFECDGSKKIAAYVVVDGKLSRELTTVDCSGCMQCDAALASGGDHADAG